MKLVEAVYFSISIAGAILVALNVGVQLVGYSLFLCSSILGAWLSYHSNASRTLFAVNIIFAAINCLGIVRA